MEMQLQLKIKNKNKDLNAYLSISPVYRGSIFDLPYGVTENPRLKTPCSSFFFFPSFQATILIKTVVHMLCLHKYIQEIN
jgi:hypothetical protein